MSSSLVTLNAFFGREPSTGSHMVSDWHLGEQLAARFDWYRHMRRHAPVALDPESGVWGIFRYADVRRAMTDSGDFSNEMPEAPSDDPVRGTMLRVDPPRHRELRGLANQAFTARRIAGMREQIHVLSTDLVRNAATGDTLDVVTALGRVLPTMVIGSLLGIDLDRTDDFRRWTDAFMHTQVYGSDAEHSAILAEMDRYFIDIIAERRQRPGSDLISGAVQAEEGGALLTDRDILQFCKLLLLGGTETTTHLIGSVKRTV
ncbi:hypothetical protein [Amycolatopsis sp. cmx-4-61]|uniref:hypothetical protein n=1 Tax=Amycolatopsis sp. cmx-4-61 TaxID=2790937 RepID=UPI00397CED4C